MKVISIRDFQSHKNTNIEFCNGLNVIAGASDSGKSSILRAMGWFIKNRPSGDAIRNWDCKKTDPVSVTITLEDNGKEETITKERTGSTSKYISSKFGILAVVGRDVPEEVAQLLNLSDFNFQTQHDAYFLLNDSPGSVAKTLNDLVGLSIIDTIFKNINSKSLMLKRQSEENQVSIDKLQVEIDQLQYLDVAEKELIEVETLSELLERKKGDLEKIMILVNSINDTRQNLEKAKKILPAEKDLIIIKEKNENLNQITVKHFRISNTITSINESKSKLKAESEWLTIESPYLELRPQFDKQKNLRAKQLLLSKIIENYSSNKNAEQNATKKVETLKSELRNKIESNKICPTCFRPLDKKTIERMMQ